MTRKTTLRGFAGSWMSGLGYLITDDGPIMCENASTVRALEGAFGGVIAPGHTVNSKALDGKVVYYDVDEMGILEGFTPEEDWEGPEPEEEDEDETIDD